MIHISLKLRVSKEKKESDMYHKIILSSILNRKGYWKTATAAASLAVVYWHQYHTIKHFWGMWSTTYRPFIHLRQCSMVCVITWEGSSFFPEKTFWKFCLQNRKLGKSSPESSKALFFDKMHTQLLAIKRSLNRKWQTEFQLRIALS